MMDQKKIQELISRSQQEDAVAFSLLVSTFQPLVFRLAFRLLCDEDEAKDMVQETFVRCGWHWVNIMVSAVSLPGFIKSLAILVMTVCAPCTIHHSIMKQIIPFPRISRQMIM